MHQVNFQKKDNKKTPITRSFLKEKLINKQWRLLIFLFIKWNVILFFKNNSFFNFWFFCYNCFFHCYLGFFRINVFMSFFLNTTNWLLLISFIFLNSQYGQPDLWSFSIKSSGNLSSRRSIRPNPDTSMMPGMIFMTLYLFFHMLIRIKNPNPNQLQLMELFLHKLVPDHYYN